MKHFSVLFGLLFLISCSKSDRVNNCNYIANNAVVNATVNLNLPQFNQLQFTGSSAYISNEGISGVIITNVGNSSFRAWEATDPSHPRNSTCSTLTIEGANAKCGCDDHNEYSLFTGQSVNSTLPCLLKEYLVENGGNNTLYISN